MQLLLTGGYGCIGSWIARNLVERGDQVWIYDLKEDLHRLRLILDDEQVRHIHYVCGDVADLLNLKRVIEKSGITHVVHLAGLQVPVCRADPLLGAKVNVLGTLAVFEAVRQAQGQVQRLVYASSAAVFGAPEHYANGAIPDDAPLTPTTHYGAFKCCNEGNARVYYADYGLSSIGLRPWTVFGVGRDFGLTSEPTKALQALAAGRPYHITYGGQQDLQYVDDVAKIFVRCLEAEYAGAKSYNLRGHVVDTATMQRALIDVEPRAAELITFGDKQIPIAFDLDDTALQRDLGPMPCTPLVDGFRQTLELFRHLQKEGLLDSTDL